MLKKELKIINQNANLTDNQTELLIYLNKFSYLSIKQLAKLTNTSDTATNRTLLRLANGNVVRKFRFRDRLTILYQLTNFGKRLLAKKLNISSNELNPIAKEPNLNSYYHTDEMVNFIIANNLKATDYWTDKEAKKKGTTSRIPDLIIVNKDIKTLMFGSTELKLGERTAIEFELHWKSKERYDKIFKNYFSIFNLWKMGDKTTCTDYVIWVCKDDKLINWYKTSFNKEFKDHPIKIINVLTNNTSL